MCVVCLMFINGCYRVIIKCLIDLGILVMTMCRRLNTLYCISEHRDQFKVIGLTFMPVPRYGRSFFFFLFLFLSDHVQQKLQSPNQKV